VAHTLDRPPGTGKTSTILGLVGALKSRKASDDAPAHLLLCAPSNAAVDEIVKRLKEGVRRADGTSFVPNVVRIGAEQAINIGVKDVFIDELVEVKLNGTVDASSRSKSAAVMQQLRAQIELVKQERNGKFAERNNVVSNAALTAQLDLEIRELRKKMNDLGSQLDAEKDKQTQTGRAMDAARRKARLEVLTSADVICSTLSGSGHDYMQQLPFDFETVIIDQAAQSIELSSLIPLKYGCQRCIMVGGARALFAMSIKLQCLAA
jgi:senataxin